MADKCDPEVYANGVHVALIASVPARIIEAVVQEAAERSGCRMDWHYVGGRANVLALGDKAKAEAALLRVLSGLPTVMWNCAGESNPVPSLEQQRQQFKTLVG